MTPRSSVPRTARRRRRYRVVFAVRGAGGEMRTGFTEDVSTGGLFIQTAQVHPPRTPLALTIDLGAEEPVRITGVVVWAKRAPTSLMGRKRSGMGVRFDAPCADLAGLADGA